MRILKALLVIVALSVVSISGAFADHKPKSYCSPSGDICLSVKNSDGKRLLSFVEAAEYVSSFNLCVTAPDGSKECKRFQVKEDGPVFSRQVNWAKHYPDMGPGDYIVAWRSGGGTLGKRLGFHVAP
ncbi:MAG: hypothetical protein GEU71_00015 [Actinobacteria bacterium]|nr:hypothetical protein [Actinomycetota bacterium]